MSGEHPDYRKKQDEAERKRKDAEEQAYRDKVISALEGIRNDLDAERKKSGAKQRRDHRIDRLVFRRERRKFYIDLAAVIGAIVAALLLLIQSGIFFVTMLDARHAAKKAHLDNIAALARADAANKQSRAFFDAAQQPILWQPSEHDLIQYDKPLWSPLNKSKPNGPGFIRWSVHIKNFGLGTALHVGHTGTIFIKNVACETMHRPEVGAVPIPPQAGVFLTIQCASVQITRQDYLKLLKTDLAIAVVVETIYDDAYGHTYQSDFCGAELASGAIANCTPVGVPSGIIQIK